MTTPLLMVTMLTLPWLVVWRLRSFGLQVSARNAGAIGLALLFLLTASGHFFQAQAMAEMLPPFVPGRVPVVYLTGILEIALGLGIALVATRRLAGLVAIAVLILFFPANVYAAFAQVEMGGHAWGPVYLLLRAPLQALLIAWAWWFTLRPAASVAGRSAGRRPITAAS